MCKKNPVESLPVTENYVLEDMLPFPFKILSRLPGFCRKISAAAMIEMLVFVTSKVRVSFTFTVTVLLNVVKFTTNNGT